MPVPTNARGEICDLLDVNQFVPGRSAYECVAYAAALLKFAGQPGKGPTGSIIAASNLAQYWYGRLEGGNGANNTNGMSLDDLHTMLGGMGLTWTPAILSLEGIRQSIIASARPCIVSGTETGMHDLALGDSVPYNWRPTGNHVIVVSGVTHEGNFLVHDTANIDPEGRVRPGPRVYDASKMQLVSATSVSIPGPALHIPAGWHDDGATLTAPNGVPVVRGFRQAVLNPANQWNPENWPLAPEAARDPLEDSNPALGGGTWQPFRWTVLEWTAQRGVFSMWSGQELLHIRQQPKTPPVVSSIPPSVAEDLKASAKLIGDTVNHMLSQVEQLLQTKPPEKPI